MLNFGGFWELAKQGNLAEICSDRMGKVLRSTAATVFLPAKVHFGVHLPLLAAAKSPAAWLSRMLQIA